MKSILNSILKIIDDDPYEMNYLGIGSCPSIVKGHLHIQNDQLVPYCFREHILKEKKQLRIVHFDPFFENYKEFLKNYFEEWNTIPLDYKGGYRWINETLDIIIIPDRLEHKEDYIFFQNLSSSILNAKGKLVVQEYTGQSLKELNRKLYTHCEQKELFKRRILLDMTFETDSGCSTDMMRIKPFYDSSSHFINLHFMKDNEVGRRIGSSPELDTLLRKKYTSKFLHTLNSIHVDYRRKLKGESVMYGSSHYTNNSSPDEIMIILQRKLTNYFSLLYALHVVSDEDKKKLQEAFASYTTYDPYKWYDVLYKLVNRP